MLALLLAFAAGLLAGATLVALWWTPRRVEERAAVLAEADSALFAHWYRVGLVRDQGGGQ